MWSSLKRLGPGLWLQFLPMLVFGITVPSLASHKSNNSQVTHNSTYSATYQNPVYGYRIRIPDTLTAIGASPPSPNHGVRIDLPGGKDSIWVDAHHVDEDSLSRAVDSTISQLTDTCGGTDSVRRTRATLGKQPAIRLDYKCSKNPPSFNIRYESYRYKEGFAPILYEVGLTASQERSLQGRNSDYFEVVLNGFEFLPLN
jgi:hypothetical protein